MTKKAVLLTKFKGSKLHLDIKSIKLDLMLDMRQGHMPRLP